MRNRLPLGKAVCWQMLCIAACALLSLPLQAQPAPTIRTVNLLANEIVYDPVSGKLYASVPSAAGSAGNSITIIDPTTATSGPSIFIGSEPNKLALSDDGKYLYVGLDGAAAVRRLNLRTLVPEPQFSLGNDANNAPYLAGDLAVVPGCPESVAVARSSTSSFSSGIALFDNGVRRGPNSLAENFNGAIAFGVSPNVVFGFGPFTGGSGSDLRRVQVMPDSLRFIDTSVGLITGDPNSARVGGNLIFTTVGRVIDPITKSILGTFAAGGSTYVVPDLALSRAFFLKPPDVPAGPNIIYRILAFSTQTFLPVGAVDIPGISGAPRGLIRFGADGFAFPVRSNPPVSTGDPKIYLVNAPALVGVTSGPTVTSAASFRAGSLAPDAISTIFGTNFSTVTLAADALPLPSMLGGASIKIKDNVGTERTAPLFFVSPNQINFLVPAGTSPGSATATITASNGTVFMASIQVAPVAAGIFTANANGLGAPAATVLRVRADNSQSFEAAAQFDADANRFVPRQIDLGPEQGAGTDRVFLVLYGTGLRGRNGLANTVARIGGDDAMVVYAGAQGTLIGLDQINLLVPRSQIGRGEVDVALSIDGSPTNLVKVNIK